MRLLHTADWHLADRLGSVDRTADLRGAVANIAAICEERDVDVLLVAGDLFSDRARIEALRDEVRFLNETLRPFLSRGGTVVAVTGNHDRESFCGTLKEAFRLTDPTPRKTGDLLPSGRLHLATHATHFRLADRSGCEAQFVLLPYPTPARYLTGGGSPAASVSERNRQLTDALRTQLTSIRSRIDATKPAVLSAHLYVSGAGTGSQQLFRISEEQDICFAEQNLTAGWSYVGLGHIHQPQCLSGLPHVRYSGSPERLDLGEREDEKSCVLVDIGPAGLTADPELVPLDATPIAHIEIDDWPAVRDALDDRWPERERTLVRLDVRYSPGETDLPELTRQLREAFPRCYRRDIRPRIETGSPAESEALEAAFKTRGVAATVGEYLKTAVPDDTERAALTTLLDELTAEDQP